MGSPESHPCRRGHRVSGPANEHQRNSEAGGDGGGERRDEHLEKKPDGLLGRQLPEVRGRGRRLGSRRSGGLWMAGRSVDGTRLTKRSRRAGARGLLCAALQGHLVSAESPAAARI